MNDYTPSQLISYGIDSPGKMAIDSNDYIYVIDADKKSIVKYDGSGVYKKRIITNFNPISIAVNKKGQLFVGDEITGNIYNVNHDGSKTLFYTGTKLPNSMVFGFNNILYVTDSEAKQVLGLDVSGNTVLQFSDANFTFPTGIAFDEKNNRLVVSEHGGIGPETETYCNQSGGWSVRNYGANTSIYTFDLNGTLLNKFGCFGRFDGQNHRIQGVRVGPCGNIYAVDPYLARISVYDENGIFLTHVGQPGNGSGEFDLPIDLQFSSDHRLIVSSMDKASLDVFQITMPTPSAKLNSADITTCSGSAILEVEFTGTAPWTFTYTIDGLNPTQITTSDNPYALQASDGWYEITGLTDGNLNTATCFTGGAKVTASTAPIATVSATSLNTCKTENSGIDISFTGTPPFTFTYTINEQQPTEVTTVNSNYTLIPEKSGLYEITSLTDDGCSGTVINGSVDVTVYPLPTAEITNGNGRINIPEGNSTELTIAFTGTGPWTFIYKIDDKNPVTISTDKNPYLLMASLVGTYEVVQITDAYCTSNLSKGYPEIVFGDTPIPAEATIQTGTEYICEGNTALIPIHFTGTAPWTFNYTIDGVHAGELTTNETPYQLMVSTSGVYELSSVSDASGNPGNYLGTAVVILNPTPFIDLLETIMFCEGDSVELNPGNFESYLWNDSSTNQMLTVYSPGFYSVTVTDQNGCTNSATIEVIVNPLPVLDLGPDIDICEGDPAYILDAGLFESYLWSDGSTGRTLEVSTTGTYGVTVINTNGCSTTDYVNVTVHTFVNSDFLYTVNRLEVKFISNATNASAHYWDFGDNTGSTEQNPTHTYSRKGNYTVSYSATNDFCGTIKISKTISIGSNTETDVVVIYPNPSYGEFTIKITPLAPITTDISVRISSTSGQTIYSQVFSPMYLTQYDGSMYIPINIESFSKGIYIVYINAGNFAEQEKLVLKN